MSRDLEIVRSTLPFVSSNVGSMEPRVQSAESYRQSGISHLARYRFDLAADALKEAVELQPEHAGYRHDYGLALQLLGAEKGAAAQFREAIRLDPTAPASFVKLGRMLRLGGDAEGERLYQTAYDRLIESSERLVSLGQEFIEENEPLWAVRALQRATNLNQDSDAAHALLGRVLPQLGRFEEAQNELAIAIRLNPGSVRPYVDRAFTKRANEQDLPVIDKMREIVKSPRLPLDERRYLHYALGRSFDDLRRYDEAIRHFDEANGIMRLLSPDGGLNRAALSAWYDWLIHVFSAETITRIAPASDSDRPILIVGMFRSGTTLVEQLLSNHPDVGGGGEIPYLHRAFSALIGKEGFDPKLSAPFTDRYLRILGGRAQGKERVTDKMPQNYVALGAVVGLLPNARIIHVRRKPIDNALAIYVTPFSHSLDFAHDKEDIVFYYRTYQRLMQHWRRTLPSKCFLEVDYEEVVDEPRAVVSRMLDFCGLPWSENCLHPESNETPIFTPSAWQARQPIFRTSVDRWKNYEPWLGPLRALL